MNEANGKINGRDALLVYSDFEDPAKVDIICSKEWTKSACALSFCVGMLVTGLTFTYARLLKRAYSKRDSK